MIKDIFTELQDYQAYFITDSINRYYFTGLNSTAGNLVITNKGQSLFIDDRYYSYAKDFLSKKVNVYKFTDDDCFFAYLKNAGITELFVDYSIFSVREYNRLIEKGFSVLDGNKFIKSIKIIKTDNEIDYILKACDIAYSAFIKTLSHIKTGVSETYIKNVLEGYMRQLGADDVSFDTIIAFGANSAVPHHETCSDTLLENSCILMDFGCKYKGYCSDVTRTLYYGQPNDEFLKAYDVVLKANILSEEEIVAGITGKQADKIARDYLDKNGLGQYFTHSLGHGIGLNIHEEPYLSKKGEDVLLDNMVFSIEPGVYFEGKFGIRIEDTVVLKDNKVKRLFNDDKKLIVLTVTK